MIKATVGVIADPHLVCRGHAGKPARAGSHAWLHRRRTGHGLHLTDASRTPRRWGAIIDRRRFCLRSYRRPVWQTRLHSCPDHGGLLSPRALRAPRQISHLVSRCISLDARTADHCRSRTRCASQCCGAPVRWSLRRTLAVLGLAAVCLAAPACHPISGGKVAPPPIIGAWFVTIPEAPFQYHMFIFNSDGTVLQSNPDAGDANSSDSNALGVWLPDGDRIGDSWSHGRPSDTPVRQPGGDIVSDQGDR